MSKMKTQKRPFSDSEYNSRVRCVQNMITANSLHCLVSYDISNIYYLTGFCTPGCAFHALIISPKSLLIITRDLEASNTPIGIKTLTYSENENPSEVFKKVIPPYSNVGFEGININYRMHMDISNALNSVHWIIFHTQSLIYEE